MSHAVIRVGWSQIGKATQALNLQAAESAVGVAVANNMFTLATVETHYLDVRLTVGGAGEPKTFQLALYNETTGAVVQQLSGEAGYSGHSGEYANFLFNFTPNNNTDVYSFRCTPEGGGGNANMMSVMNGRILVTNFPASALPVNQPALIWSNLLDLTVPQVVTFALPGIPMVFDEFGIISVTANGVITQPTIQWGILGSPLKIVDPIQSVNLSLANKRELYDIFKTDDVETSLVMQIIIGATATALTGLAYAQGKVRP